MKFLFYGDLQLGRKRTDYMEFMQSALELLSEIIDREKPDFLINLGDLLDDFGKVDVKDLVYAFDWMQYLGSKVKRGHHWIIKGNHDIADEAGEYSTVHVMECGVNRVIRSIETPEIDGFGRVLVLPYGNNYATMREEIEKMKGFPIKAIFAHTDWLGIRPSIKSSYVSTDGLDPERLMELFPNVPIFGGHYHTPMSIGNLNIVGSPLYKDFSDVHSEFPRGFTVWDTKTGITRIENPNTYYCAEVRAENSKDLQAQFKALLPHKASLKVKVYVPLSLMTEASVLFGPFLWSAVYALESAKKRVEHMADVTMHTAVPELVDQGVKTAGNDYDAALLRQFGMEAFRCA